MTTRIRGFRGKTRHKLQKSFRTKGKISQSRYFAKYDEGDRVCLNAEPAIQKGMYHPRFHGKSGVVKRKVGNCYEVTINDIGKDKIVVVHPIHIKPVK